MTPTRVRDIVSVEQRIRAALPGYDIGEQIGLGGCGIVLSGTHQKLKRRVAIKQIPIQFAEDDAVRRRFRAEAQLMAAIDHPHVVPVYDYVEDDELCLLVMEYLPGGTVASRFATDGFDAGSAIAVALACAAGLHDAHKHGVLHRDIKPANLLFSANGTVKLTDFGIAKIIGGNDTLMTRAGEVVGTPSYIAPEQARGQELSPATDVYALATMVYQLLSGKLPFPAGDDSMAVLFMHAFEQPTPLSTAAPGIPSPIADVVMRGLATQPTDRFDSAEAFGVALAEPAADSWGTDWLTPVGIPVIGADTIVAAATRSTQPAGERTQAPHHAGAQGHAGSPDASSTARVRPAEPLTRPRIELSDLDRHDVVPVQRAINFRSPRLPFALATVLAIIAIAVAVIGLGALPRGGDLPAGAVTFAGIDPTTAVATDVDLSKPIPVTVTGAFGDRVTLGWDVLGMTIGRHDAALQPGPAGLAGSVPPPLNPHLIAGRTTAVLTVFNGEIPTATYRFGVKSTQPATTTAVAVGAMLLVLFAAAYVESGLRALRRGRSRLSAGVTVPLGMAGLAVATVAGAWVLLGHEPTRTTVVVSGGLAIAAGIAAAVGGARVGRTFRHRRSQRALERALAMKIYGKQRWSLVRQ
jgi:serine/threonine-protein kinase